MGFPIRKMTTVADTGDFDGDAAGTSTAGDTVPMGTVQPGSLCTEVTVDAETNTIEIFVDWQVSDDASTWLRVTPENAALNVKIATGTAGADAAVTRVIPAPAACYSFRYARAALRNEVASGTTSDTYSIKYHWLKPSV